MKSLKAKLLAGLLTGTVVIGGTVAFAQMAKNDEMKCVADIPEEMMGNQLGFALPIMLVHGLNGNNSTMASIDAVIANSITPVRIARFNYTNQNTNWITDTQIGFRLGMWIACIAEHSRQNGGPGKVVTVSPSMGGLAVRYASSLDDPFNPDKKVADSMGLVVTIGTPNNGAETVNLLSPLTGFCILQEATVKTDTCDLVENIKSLNSPAGQAMSKGSDEIKRLPELPSTVPVLAIAGEISLVTYTPGNRLVQDIYSDGIVPVDSATDNASSDNSAGGGKKIFKCDYVLLSSAIPCSHNALLNYGPAQDAIIEGIKQYQEWLKAPDCMSGQEIADHSTMRFYKDLEVLDVVCQDDWIAIKFTSSSVDHGPLLQIMKYNRSSSQWYEPALSRPEMIAQAPPRIRELIQSLPGHY